MEKEINIKDTKIKLKFKIGWKESGKKERILSILFYAIMMILIMYLIIK